jgi:hypothetical protein
LIRVLESTVNKYLHYTFNISWPTKYNSTYLKKNQQPNTCSNNQCIIHTYIVIHVIHTYIVIHVIHTYIAIHVYTIWGLKNDSNIHIHTGTELFRIICSADIIHRQQEYIMSFFTVSLYAKQT